MKNSADLAAPEGLSAEARQIWADLVREYGLVDAAGLVILRCGLEAHDRMRLAQRDIATHRATTTDRFGQLRAHPLLCVERDARSQFLAAMRALHFDVEPLRDGPGRPGGA